MYRTTVICIHHTVDRQSVRYTADGILATYRRAALYHGTRRAACTTDRCTVRYRHLSVYRRRHLYPTLDRHSCTKSLASSVTCLRLIVICAQLVEAAFVPATCRRALPYHTRRAGIRTYTVDGYNTSSVICVPHSPSGICTHSSGHAFNFEDVSTRRAANTLVALPYARRAQHLYHHAVRH
ncbi:hypothetical protein AVEN_51711-1 [Araneus ventricosus]|uniref:Uncharacterized protein n=1 Tax=Araneus ventricosus TaxID=182803 RepID=A0A4Y2GF95_ARAVE|nr:hypothetical protein AVEN_51711-1 [Araneus ventricosus]